MAKIRDYEELDDSEELQIKVKIRKKSKIDTDDKNSFFHKKKSRKKWHNKTKDII